MSGLRYQCGKGAEHRFAFLTSRWDTRSSLDSDQAGYEKRPGQGLKGVLAPARGTIAARPVHTATLDERAPPLKRTSSPLPSPCLTTSTASRCTGTSTTWPSRCSSSLAHLAIDAASLRPGDHLLLRADRRPARWAAGRQRPVACHAQQKAAVQPVVLSGPLLVSYGRQLDELAAFIEREWQSDSPEGVFALHVFEAVGESGPVLAWPPLSVINALEAGRAGTRRVRLPARPPNRPVARNRRQVAGGTEAAQREELVST